MSLIPQVTPPRRRFLRWALIAAGLGLAPFVILAVVAASYLTLDRDAAVLRRHVMAATNAEWDTKIQMDLGRATINAVDFGLGFFHAHNEVAEARRALAAVRQVSVGVYGRAAGRAHWSQEQLFTEVDTAMQKRGWSRLVGVRNEQDTVLIFVQQDLDADAPAELCLAVVTDEKLVVVSTTVDTQALGELVQHHTGSDITGQLHVVANSIRL